MPLYGQNVLSPNDEKIMTDNVKASVQNYYAMLANIGSTNNSFDERRLFIEDVINSYFLNESIRVCNDLYTGGVRDYAIRDYLGTIMSTYPRSEGVKFRHTIEEIKGPYSGQGDFAFYLLRVERHLIGLSTSGIMQDASMTLDFYLRFDRSGGKWNYTPKIYDIRKAEQGVVERYSIYMAVEKIEKPKSLEELEKEPFALLRGKVVNEKNKKVLIGVPVLLFGTTIGTITDIYGNFALKISPGSHKVFFSYKGYKKEIYLVDAKADEIITLDIILKPRK